MSAKKHCLKKTMSVKKKECLKTMSKNNVLKNVNFLKKECLKTMFF
jgi:hypothetical protein